MEYLKLLFLIDCDIKVCKLFLENIVEKFGIKLFFLLFVIFRLIIKIR